MTDELQRRRSEDAGWLTRFYDWVDERQVDKHAVSVGIFIGTIKITSWAMGYATADTDKSGFEVAAVIAAVTAPYMALQAAALKFYFDRDRDR